MDQIKDKLMASDGQTIGLAPKEPSPDREKAPLEGEEELTKKLQKLNTADKMRMSGAAKKRFRYLRQKGLSVEEARNEALKPIERKTPTTGPKVTSKRGRSTGSTPEATAKRVKKAPGPSTTPIRASYSQAAQAVKMGIIPEGYPEAQLTPEQNELLLEAIMVEVRIVGMKGTLRPSFRQVHHRPGWLALSCGDRATADWLKTISHKLQPWEGAKLKVEEEANLPHSEIMVGYFPGSQTYSAETILETIQSQNNLQATGWRVLRKVPAGPKMEVTFAMDSRSAEVLKELKWALNYRFGQVTLRAKGKKEAEGKDPGAPSTSTTPETGPSGSGSEAKSSS